jgi:A/G-specific adenine glycosylase
VAPGIHVPSSRQRRFVQRLLRWYTQHGRDLPWRHTRNPYRILVSEIMLQQTQVARVIPKYREWMYRYPSLEVLARAPIREVREAWYPLGYNIRPLRLRDIARTVLAQHGGKLPRTKDALLKLKGIGRYTAGAVLTFAYGQAEPILDTNVRRVLRRIFCGARAPSDRDLWALAERLLPPKHAYNFNQALMDFGATVCTARAPACPTCPMRRMCAAYAHLRPRG